MGYFELTENQKMLTELAKDFARKEMQPAAGKYDKLGGFPHDIHKKALDLGLLNLTTAEKYGGLGFSHLDFILVTEELAYACVGIAGALSLNNMLADVFDVAGSDGQKTKYLGRLCKGEVAGYAMTEPGAGSNVAGIQTTAVKKGDSYIINGSKTWISNSSAAGFFIVFAKTNPAETHKGISAFIVEKDAKGLRIGKNLEKLGQKAFPAAELFFADVATKEILGIEGEGFAIAMKVFDRSRPMVAALGTGLSQRCLDESLLYAKTRQTMGKPIAAHQLIGHKLAEMGMRTEASRLLTHKSAACIDQKIPNTLIAAYAKTFASDTAVWAASEAIQIFGGMGYSTEYPVEKLYRDAKVLQIYEGTNEIQRLIMARELTQEGP